jgi:hypothetical protein
MKSSLLLKKVLCIILKLFVTKQMPKVTIPYTCPRCGYTTNHKGVMRKHLYNLKKTCASAVSNIDLNDNVKEYVLNYKVYILQNRDDKKIQQLQQQVYFLKQNRTESFYQEIVEAYLQGSHKKLKHGVTDVTNDKVHAEIKRWECFMEAIGQLTYYNWMDPKDELHIYFFGRSSAKDSNFIIDLLIGKGYKVHTFRDVEDGIIIHCHNTQLDVFTKLIF